MLALASPAVCPGAMSADTKGLGVGLRQPAGFLAPVGAIAASKALVYSDQIVVEDGSAGSTKSTSSR